MKILARTPEQFNLIYEILSGLDKNFIEIIGIAQINVLDENVLDLEIQNSGSKISLPKDFEIESIHMKKYYVYREDNNGQIFKEARYRLNVWGQLHSQVFYLTWNDLMDRDFSINVLSSDNA